MSGTHTMQLNGEKIPHRQQVLQLPCIDKRRIHCTGYSNGARFCYWDFLAAFCWRMVGSFLGSGCFMVLGCFFNGHGFFHSATKSKHWKTLKCLCTLHRWLTRWAPPDINRSCNSYKQFFFLKAIYSSYNSIYIESGPTSYQGAKMFFFCHDCSFFPCIQFKQLDHLKDDPGKPRRILFHEGTKVGPWYPLVSGVITLLMGVVKFHFSIYNWARGPAHLVSSIKVNDALLWDIVLFATLLRGNGSWQFIMVVSPSTFQNMQLGNLFNVPRNYAESPYVSFFVSTKDVKQKGMAAHKHIKTTKMHSSGSTPH